MDKETLLKSLHEIQIPNTLAWWPLAPGWYGVVGIILAGAIAVYGIYKFQKRKRYNQRIWALYSAAEHIKDSTQCMAELSKLLKRIALLKYPAGTVAQLHGQAWLEFLNKTGHTQEFTSATGQALTAEAYKKQSNMDIEPLLRLTKSWITIHLGKKNV